MSPWVSGESLSPANLNRHAAEAATAAGFSSNTLTAESGLTIGMSSAASMRDLLVGHVVNAGGTPLSTGSATQRLVANSSVSNYLYFEDSSGARSNYVLGSNFGGTSDGLNLGDASANTMIVSFSKQSVRFFQPVVGPVFDTGGALSSTYNAALFAIGSSRESQIQAAITAAAADGIARVYVPANLYPYSAASISFSTRVQMVREGGNWATFDIQAYGANPSGLSASQTAIMAAISGATAAGGGGVFIGQGKYAISSSILIRGDRVTIEGTGAGSVLSSVGDTRIFDIQSAHSVVIQQMRIVGALAGPSSITDLIFMTANSGSTLRGCIIANNWLENASRRAVHVELQCEDVLIQNNLITGSTDIGIFVTGSSSTQAPDRITVTGNAVSNVSNHAISMDWANRSIIANNSVFSTHNVGITSSHSCLQSLIIGNSIDSTTNQGIIVENRAHRNLVIGNTILNTGSDGILIAQGDSPGPERTVVQGNMIFNAFRHGIHVLSAPHTTVIGNSISSTSQQGIRLANDFGATVTANSIQSAGVDGINVVSDTSQFVLSGNCIVNSTERAIDLNGCYHGVVSNNVCWYNNGTFGAGVFVFSRNTNVAITGNSCFSNKVGIDLSNVLSTGTVLVANNIAFGNGTDYKSSDPSLQVCFESANMVGGATSWSALGDGTSLKPTYAFASEQSVGFYRSGNSTIAQSYGTFNLNQSRLVSIRTTATSLASTSMLTDEMAFFVGGASGATLGLRVNGIVYLFNSSSTTKG